MVEALAKRQVDLILGRPQTAWRGRFKTPDPLKRAWFEKNAMAEVLLVHVRALTKFLFVPRRLPRNARAASDGAGRPGSRTASPRTISKDPIGEWRKDAEGRGRRPELLRDEKRLLTVSPLVFIRRCYEPA